MRLLDAIEQFLQGRGQGRSLVGGALQSPAALRCSPSSSAPYCSLMLA